MSDEAPFSNAVTRRTLVAVGAASLAGCHGLIEQSSRPDTPTPHRTEGETSSGPFKLSMTVEDCDGVELILRTEPDGEPVANGTGGIEALLERGEEYILEARHNGQEIETFSYTAVGKENPVLVLERCNP